MKKIVAVGIVALILGIPGINIFHHVELPTLNKYRIVSAHNIDSTYPFLHKHTDITLEDEVKSNIWYEDVSKVLRDAKEGDTITFHLMGYGGREDSLYMLINQIKNSKAIITMSVEAPVYSAHAYLAVAGDKLVMAPYTWLMFHFSSVLDVDCSKAKGLDRGVSKEEKCKQFKQVDVDLGIKMISTIDLLTAEEKSSIITGHDVYLTSDVVSQRQGETK